MKWPVLSLGQRRRLFSGLVLLPETLFVLVVILYPLYLTFKLSFFQVDLYGIAKPLTSSPTLRNYTEMFSDRAFWQSLKVSGLYTLFATPLTFLVGFGLALLLDQPLRGRRIFRVLLAMPWAIPTAVGSMVFMLIFDSSFGVANYLLIRLHLVPGNIDWLGSPTTALATIVVTTIWKNCPFFMLMLLAGLQAIPVEFYEAARVDGAGRVRQFFSITLPALRPIITISLMLNALWVFREFDTIYVMTGGGPARMTESLAVSIYQEAFRFLHVGHASALGIVTFIVCLAIVLACQKPLRKEFYS
jgi:multiple sugar transport system permease protein